MADVRTNIFGIGEVYELQREGLWVEKNRESYREYGYFAGARNSSLNVISTVDRIDFSNDTSTAKTRGPLAIGTWNHSSSGNSNYGWFYGGDSVTSVQRIDYANDAATASLRSTSPGGKDPALGNNFYGYIKDRNTNISRIQYSNDTTIPSLRLNTINNWAETAGVLNARFGYFGGGYTGCGTPGFRSGIERFEFANDTANAISRGNLTVARYCEGVGNENYGYFLEGYARSTVDRIDYANDTAGAVFRTTINLNFNWGTFGNSNFGYFAGGRNTSSVV